MVSNIVPGAELGDRTQAVESGKLQRGSDAYGHWHCRAASTLGRIFGAGPSRFSVARCRYPSRRLVCRHEVRALYRPQNEVQDPDLAGTLSIFALAFAALSTSEIWNYILKWMQRSAGIHLAAMRFRTMSGQCSRLEPPSHIPDRRCPRG